MEGWTAIMVALM
jgi:hypothetical protein